MEAKETRYNGHRFRSRLEARWVVFFDAMNLTYEYEKKTWAFNNERPGYIPDFWLPELRTWIELKGKHPTQNELHKCILLARDSNFPVLMGWGAPGELDEGQMLKIHPPRPDYDPDYDWINLTGYWWYACKNCGHVGVSFQAKTSTCKCADWSSASNQGRSGWVYDNARIETAYHAARSAWFKSGKNQEGMHNGL